MDRQPQRQQQPVQRTNHNEERITDTDIQKIKNDEELSMAIALETLKTDQYELHESYEYTMALQDP